LFIHRNFNSSAILEEMASSGYLEIHRNLFVWH